jgi:hypothetical protein
MKTRGLAAATALWVGMVTIAGCLDNFEGARLEVNLTVSESDTFHRQDLILPTPGLPQSDPGWYSHYELHANILGEGTVRLTSFIIQPALHSHHPCLQFEPDRYCRDAAGNTCDPYINLGRFSNIDDEILLAVSVPPTTDDGTGYRHVPGYDLSDQSRFPAALFVNPDLTDPAQRYHRDNLDQPAVEAFCAELPADYYLGNPNQLTKPRSGDNYGAVDSADARTNFFVGGITFFTGVDLELMTELMLTREKDPARLSPENIEENLAPGEQGQVILLAQENGPWGSISFEHYRGVMTVFMESPVGLPLTWSSAIYYNMDEDPLNF